MGILRGIIEEGWRPIGVKVVLVPSIRSCLCIDIDSDPPLVCHFHHPSKHITYVFELSSHQTFFSVIVCTAVVPTLSRIPSFRRRASTIFKNYVLYPIDNTELHAVAYLSYPQETSLWPNIPPQKPTICSEEWVYVCMNISTV